MKYYILVDGQVTETEDVAKLEACIRSGENVVGKTVIDASTKVSTILCGLDMNTMGLVFSELGLPPLLFETAVRIGGDMKFFRYETLEQAKAGHDDICTRLREGRHLED